jgi:hypothetical protein
MTNREKYAEQIIDMALNDIGIAVDKKGSLCDCHEIRCNDCMWASNGRCREKLKEWSEQEYVESPVDWSKVPVDTKILVRDSETGQWRRRHFARYENNFVLTWCNGRTSYSSGGCEDVTDWKYAKLAEDTV